MWSVCGQASAVGYLQRCLSSGRIAHAYLFLGPSGVGKSTLSLQLARALLCERADPPCSGLGAAPFCKTCQRIERGLHPDVRTIDLGEGGRHILRDQVMELRSEVALRPSEGRRKVYRILEAQLLKGTGGHNAANLLLKTLEEPPPGVTLILTAPQSDDLLPTIVSRCQRVMLLPASRGEITSYITERYSVEASAADRLARLSRGRVGWAVRAATDEAFMLRQREMADLLFRLVGAEKLERIKLADELAEAWVKQPDYIRSLLQAWTLWIRDAMLVRLGLGDRALNVDRLQEIDALAASLDVARAAAALHCLDQLGEDLERNVSPRLAMDVALLELPRLAAA